MIEQFRVNDRVRVRGRDGTWIVRSVLRLGGLVVAPEGNDQARLHVQRVDLTRLHDELAPASSLAGETAAVAAAAMQASPPEWLADVVGELVAAWRATWGDVPEAYRSIEVAANVAAVVVSQWVLGTALPEQLLALAAHPEEDARPQAIGALVGVVLPVAYREAST